MNKDKFNFFELDYELENILEELYINVIVPYLDDIPRKEILQKLDKRYYIEFKNFFYSSSPYYRYIKDNLSK